MFFTAINTLSKNIASIDLDAITRTALEARGADIAELNRDQLRKGQTSFGTVLPPYSARSVTEFGKTPGPIKLYDTGAFYAGIKPAFVDKSFAVEDTDDKTEMLQRDYGDDILGLSTESIAELAQDALGSVQYGLRNAMTK